MNQIETILKKLSEELKKFMINAKISKESLSLILNISIQELDLILNAEIDLKISDIINISLKIGKVPRFLFD